MSVEILKTYAKERNLSDVQYDEIEQDYLYFRLGILSEVTTKFLFIDIIVNYGRGLIPKIARHILHHARGHLQKTTEVPVFKEEYALHYLNQKDAGEQFILVILSLLNTVEHTPANMRKLKDIITFGYKQFLISKSRKTSPSRNIIRYV